MKVFGMFAMRLVVVLSLRVGFLACCDWMRG